MERTANWKMGLMMGLEEKALERLSEIDPATTEFNYTLNNLGLLLQIAEQVKYDSHLWEDIVKPMAEPAIAPPVIVTTEDEDDGSEALAEEPVTCALTFDEVKAKLVQLARTGVDVGAALNRVGASRLSDVPQEKYAELLAIAEELE